MSGQLVVRPTAFRQFAGPAEAFCLVTDADLVDEVVLVDSLDDEADLSDVPCNGGRGYRKSLVVGVAAEDDLADVLAAGVPESADVLVVRRRSFITSPDTERIGAHRRLVVVPCASTPVTVGQLRYFLDVVQRADPAAQLDRAERFFAAVEEAGTLRLVSAEHGTSCDFDPLAEDYVWNQQAGFLTPGEQQIAPAGELSVLPMEITDFDPNRRLALTGTLALRGWPIVHGGYAGAEASRQTELYTRLSGLLRHPVLITVDDGEITGCRPGSSDVEATAVTRVLDDLLAAQPQYRTVWELGFGINPDMTPVPANCGLNEPYGGSDGVVHFGLGLTPFTEFALTFLCPATALVDASGRSLIGPASGGSSAPRIRRVRSGSCACYPGGDPSRPAVP